jgi:hypothetical protein
VRVWLVDLEHLKVLGAQVAHEAGRVAAGRFHAQRGDRPEAPNPRQQLVVAGRVHRECSPPEQAPAVVEHARVVRIGVRINANHDPARGVRHAVHRRPFIPAGGTAGAGGQNSDEALVASRFL